MQTAQYAHHCTNIMNNVIIQLQLVLKGNVGNSEVGIVSVHSHNNYGDNTFY